MNLKNKNIIELNKKNKNSWFNIKKTVKVSKNSFYSLEIFFKLLIKKGFKFKNFLLFFKLLILLKINKLKSNKLGKRVPIYFILNTLFKLIPTIKFINLHLSGKKYLVPVNINRHKQKFILILLLIKNAKLRLESNFVLRLLAEICDSNKEKSATCKTLQEWENLAYDNKQYLRLLTRRFYNKRMKRKKRPIKIWVKWYKSWKIKKDLLQKHKMYFKYKTLSKKKKLFQKILYMKPSFHIRTNKVNLLYYKNKKLFHLNNRKKKQSNFFIKKKNVI